MADTLVKKPVLFVGTKEQINATTMGENDFAIVTDEEFYTKAEVDELFNGKADADLGNIPTNYDCVVESQLPTADNSYTWYRKYKSGWVEQGGSDFTPRTINAGTGITWYVTMPIPMSDTKYSIQISFDNGNLVPAVNNNKQTTTTQVYLGCKNQSTNNVTSQVQYWQVCGMPAQ